MNKWLKWIEFGAMVYVSIFTMVLAILTVIGTLHLLPEQTGFNLLIYLIIFLFALEFLFILESWRRFPVRKDNLDESTRVIESIRQLKRRGWALLGLFLLAGISLALVFVARQLPSDATGYQAFFTGFAAIGAWITGIALVVFTYQQWRLRRIEHSLLFTPQIILTSGVSPVTGPTVIDSQQYPYRIEWAVLAQNTSQLPVVVNHMEILIRLAGEDGGRQTILTPLYCHVLEPNDLRPPFQISLSTPRQIRWIVEGPNVGDAFDYVSGDSNIRDFELICKIFAAIPQHRDSFIIVETLSDRFYVPMDAPWGISTSFLT